MAIAAGAGATAALITGARGSTASPATHIPEALVGSGLGDLLLPALGPLVLCKASGRTVGALAAASAICAIGGVLAVGVAGALPESFPTMIVLGPLMVGQNLLWFRRQGGARTTAADLATEPLVMHTRG